MSTSSITHNFTYTGESAVRFAEAIAAAMELPDFPITVKAKELHGEEMKKFMEKALMAKNER